MAALVGKRLGHYEVLAVLGRGGAGEVYRARDVVLGREVALKALPPALGEDPLVVARLDREARLLAALNHPNIATLYSLEAGDLHGAGERRFLVLELVTGEDLGARLVRGALGVEEALRVAVQVARALEAAHAKAIVHRDLKPPNVIVTPEGMVKVLDFGVAKVHDDAGRWSERPASAPSVDPAILDSGSQKLTREGSVTGTIPYMAPEQLRGEDVDPRADVWAFGCLIFECLTAARAFGRARVADTFAAILRGEPDWSLLPAATPASVRELLGGCLRKEAAQRLQQIHDARVTLEEALGSRERSSAQPSIAVLPFVDQGSEPGDTYFGGGLAEEIVNALSRRPGLRVAAHGSVLQLDGTTRDARAIGETLGVGAVLEGSVRRADRRLRISVRLTNVADGYVAWSQRYDRELADVFAVEDEITEAIVTALEPALRAPSIAPRAAPSAAGLEAYELYLRGRHAWHQRTLSGVRAGIECFERAARLDSSFARAYTGIADSYATLRTYGVLPWEEARPRAKIAADRALELDPTLAEAHLSAAMFRLHFDEELALAEPCFQKSIEINPCSPLAQVYYGIFLALRRRGEDAVTQVEIARDLDPLSSMIQSLGSLALFIARRFEAAVEVADRALALQGDFPVALAVHGLACCKLGRLDEGTARFERLVSVSRRAPIYLGMLAIARAFSGREQEARALGDEISALERSGYVSPHCDLMVQAGLRDRQGVERALERCRQDRTSALVIASTAGSFLPLAERPRMSTAPPLQGPVTEASPPGVPVKSRVGGSGRVVAGKYRLLEPLGRGGMGVVYRAQDAFIRREVAVKLLDVRDETAFERLRRRMHREVIISGRLAHPHIVTVYDAGLDGDDMYLVMELVAGENLGQRLSREGPMPAETVVDVALQLLDALGYAHRQGVVHRDLKPSNVLVGVDGRIKVADFGLAKLRSLAGADEELPAALREGLTAGNVIGTAGYMAPEQLLGLPVDLRADIWSIGALLFELLSGGPLSAHVAPLSLSAALVGDAPAPTIPSVAAELEPVVARSLALRRGDRFASCEELADALRKCGVTPAQASH